MINNKTIFTVTTFCGENLDSEAKATVHSERTVGFFYNFDEAESEVINNSCDIFEYSYKYAVIEEVVEGFYPISRNRKFYKFNLETKKYEKIQEPVGLKHLCNFAIG